MPLKITFEDVSAAVHRLVANNYSLGIDRRRDTETVALVAAYTVRNTAPTKDYFVAAIGNDYPGKTPQQILRALDEELMMPEVVDGGEIFN